MATLPLLGGPNALSNYTTIANSQQQHKRVYQACIPCRRRKVRCDLGSVDNPKDPPCVRCRRESKDCFFSATRRKRKNDEDTDDIEAEYIRRNGRKRLHVDDDDEEDDDLSPAASLPKSFNSTPLIPATATHRWQPLRRPDGSNAAEGDTRGSTPAKDSNANMRMENLEAQEVMRQGMFGPHDALDLLYKAATDPAHEVHNTVASATQQPTVSTQPPKPSRDHALGNKGRTPTRMPSQSADPIDPRLLRKSESAAEDNIEAKLNRVETEPGYAEAMEAWGRFRFVRAGWFTREEAIRYIVYYYEFLSPMTPISPPAFRSPASHPTLLTEEPILAVTLLTMATRYYDIKTTGGACRSHAIHEELWRYLRKMIERCLWGQEAFGGGFCGSGADANWTSSTAPWRGLRRGSLRTLGTLESLMILTEWHPRALHFPPDEAVDELMLPSRDAPFIDEAANMRAQAAQGNVGGRKIESWLEPAWRSDRMCWMLLSNAMGLAYELGVFDDIDELLAAQAIARPEYEDEAYRLRASRIKRLLLVYLTQLAGRLGWTNMVPDSIRKTDPVFSGKKRPTSQGNTPVTTSSVFSTAFTYVPNVEMDDQVIQCWVGVSHVMHLGNERLFRSRKLTTEIITSGKYIELLSDFKPLLNDLWREFQRFELPEYIRHVLTIEYEYVRIYINSLALQAVVERCADEAMLNTATDENGVSRHSPRYLGALPLGHLGQFKQDDRQYVNEVVEGSRNLLRTVVNGLLPKGYLKHAPVRTYFRIISGAMFLLKTFALGAPKSECVVSIDLLDRVVHALRNCVVDDIHLGIRFGDLLESLITRLRDRFKFAPSPGVSLDGDAKAKSPGEANDPSGTSRVAHGGKVDLGFPSLSGSKDGPGAPERSSTPTISATPFDTSVGNFPYPTGASATHMQSGDAISNSNSMTDTVFDMGTDWSAATNDRVWFLPPGASLFQNMEQNSNVTMTDQGISGGGVDLLEFMAMDPIAPYGPMDGPGY